MNKSERLLFNYCRRYLSGVKRKYPINRDEEKSLPVFQYPVSKATYQRLYAWGNIHTGALAIPYIRQNENPDKVNPLKHPKRMSFAEKNEVLTVGCGFGFTLFGVNSDEHQLYGSGINTDSQIGYHEVNEGKPLGILYYPKPIALPLKNPKTRVLKISAGRAHMIALTDEGIFLLGNNAYGQCGRKIIEDEDYTNSNYINHIKTLDGKKVVDVECGQDHSLLLMEDGSVYSCGWSADGQTGQGHYKNTDTFQIVKGDIEQERIVKLACRSDFVLAINDKGDVFGWGNAEYGQIELTQDEQQVSVPTYMKAFKNLGKIISVAASGSHCLALNDEGQVYTWGYGLLGVGPEVQQSRTPLEIPDTLFGKNDFQPDTKVEKVVCGLSHSGAITNLGDLYMWGRNRDGCLGFGHLKDQFFPLKVAIGAIVKDAFCGVDHTVVVCKPFI